MMIRTELTCEICGEVLGEEPVSLAGILRDCGKDTLPNKQARRWLKKLPESTLLCESCFWSGDTYSERR